MVAEGVEDELTRNLLAEMGCDKLQGFLVSRPLPDDRLESWLLARTGVRSAAPGATHRRLFVAHLSAAATDPHAGGTPTVGYSFRRLFEHAPIAQSAERLHGKEKVYGSIPYWGSWTTDRSLSRRRASGHHGGVAQSVEQAAHNRCVTGSSPVTATRDGPDCGVGPVRSAPAAAVVHAKARSTHVAATDVRPKITLACVECKERNYITKKNRRNDPDRLEMKKHCPR